MVWECWVRKRWTAKDAHALFVLAELINGVKGKGADMHPGAAEMLSPSCRECVMGVCRGRRCSAGARCAAANLMTRGMGK